MANPLTEDQLDGARESLGLNQEPVSTSIKPQPARPRSAQEVNEAAQQEEEKSTSFGEIFAASARVDNNLIPQLRIEPEFQIDPQFDAKTFASQPDVSERINNMTPLGDLEEIGEKLSQAVSSDHAELLLRGMEKDHDSERLLIAAGAKALLPRMLVSVADPVDIAVTAATIPFSGGVSAAAGLTRRGRIIHGALAAGAANTATEAMLASESVFRDETDVVFAALAGITLGGAMSSLTRAENGKLNRKLNDAASDQLDSAAAKQLGEDSAGARRVAYGSDGQKNKPLSPRAVENTNELLRDMEAPEFRFKGFNWVLQNFQNKLFYSKSNTVRKLSSKMLEGGFQADKTAVRSFTAEGRANHIRREFEGGIFRETFQPFNAWAKRNGFSAARRIFSTSVGEQFYSEVGMAMRGVVDGVSPEALKAAKAVRPFMDEMFDLAEAAGVKGFNKEKLENYFPRIVSPQKWSQWNARVQDRGMAKWYREALIRGSDETIDEDVADRIAKAYVRTIRQSTAGLQQDMLTGVRLDEIDKLKEIFEGVSFADELIEELEAVKLKQKNNSGTMKHGKRRIDFDETYEGLVETVSGDRVMMKMSDLLENDARRVLKRYAQTMSGHIGLAQELGIRSRKDFDDVKKSILSDAEVNRTDMVQAQSEVDALEEAYSLLIGNSIEANPNGVGSMASRTATAYTYLARGGQFGINALAEAGNIVGVATLRSLARAVPEFGSIMKRAKDGQLDHGLARTLELMFAPGMHTLTGHAIRNLDELGEGFSTNGQSGFLHRVMAKADPYLKSGGRFTSVASGLSGVTDFTQRLAAIEWTRAVSDYATGSRRLTKAARERFRANGLSDSMQDRIFKAMKEAGVYRKKRLIDLDPQKWTDREALDAFKLAANREMRALIQENDISNATKYIHHPLGRIIFQFLRFPMEAVNKQLLRGVHHADMETAKSWMASYLIGGLVYAGQTSIEYGNDEDELKKRLSTENVAKVAFMRTGFSSLLPVAMDNAMALSGNDALFAYGRSSGLGTNIMSANPVTIAARDAAKTVSLPIRLLKDDYSLSQQDWRTATNLLPARKLLGINQAIHAVEEQLPEKSKD